MESKKNLKHPLAVKITVYVLVVLLIVAASFTAGYFCKNVTKSKEEKAMLDVIDLVYNNALYFDKETLERKQISTKEMAEQILYEYLKDDYAAYYTEEEYTNMLNKSEGKYAGVGITFMGNTLYVSGVMINSPAFKCGISKGDTVKGIKEDGKERQNFNTLEEFSAAIGSIEKSKKFKIFVDKNGAEKEYDITKESYTTTYVTYRDNEKRVNYLSDDGKWDNPKRKVFDDGMNNLPSDTAYISLKKFEGDAAKEIKDALDFMKERGRSKLIFDIRGNGGGYLDILCDLASNFIIKENGKTNTVALSIDSKEKKEYYNTTGQVKRDIINMSVIADEGTASASECFIGAVLCNNSYNFNMDKLIVQNQSLSVFNTASTFGKGIMQTTYPVYGGGALKITTAFMYFPDEKTCIHNKGIVAKEENSVTTDTDAINRAIAVLS